MATAGQIHARVRPFGLGMALTYAFVTSLAVIFDPGVRIDVEAARYFASWTCGAAFLGVAVFPASAALGTVMSGAFPRKSDGKHEALGDQDG